MTSLLHLSDLCFGAEERAVGEAVIRFARERTPDVVVVSGNLTQRAHADQFRAARTFMDRLEAKSRLVVPGNQDLPAFGAGRIFSTYDLHRRAFETELEPLFESDGLLLIGLNSTRWSQRDDGALSSTQIERVARRLEHASGEQLRVVVMHHPVAAAKPQDQEHLVQGHVRAVCAWAEAGVDLVLGGHLMLPSVVALHRRLDDLPKTVWSVQAGTATARRKRNGAGHSFNLIHVAEAQNKRRSATVERWDYAPEQRRFHRVGADELHVHDMLPVA